MPTIRPSVDLRNSYNEISDICHKYHEPVFITKNGKGDLAVMSIEAYENLNSRFELYNLLSHGLNAINKSNFQSLDDALSEIRNELKI